MPTPRSAARARRAGRAAALVVALGVLAPPPAAAQSRFFLGPVQWTPRLVLREAGFDSNIFNSATDVQEDFSAVFGPQVDAALETAFVNLTAQSIHEFVRFNRFDDENALNQRYSVTMSFPLTIVQPSVSAAYARARERSSSELDVRAPRTEISYGVSLGRPLSPSTALLFSAGILRLDYDRGTRFRDVEVATELNRRTTNVGAQFRVSLSPLTQILVDVTGSRDEFTFRTEQGTDTLRVTGAVEFAPDAVIRGSASVGYQKMVPLDSSGFAYDGLTSGIDLTYVLLERTRFAGRFSQETTYSVATDQQSCVSRQLGLEIQHNLIGPLDVSVRGSRERLAYEAVDEVGGGRLEYVTMYGGGLSLRVTDRFRVGVLYDNQRRESTAGAEFGYGRRRLYSTINYDF